MPFDKTKNQRKGFCFITFESEQVVNELLKTPKQTIAGKEVSNYALDANIMWVFKSYKISQFLCISK